MTDVYSTKKRSEIMSRIGSTNSKPELKVRSVLHGLGYRFRLHRSDLPGTPDILLPKHRVAVFVNGCFWHGHTGCKRATIPKTNRRIWKSKILQTKTRDKLSQKGLKNLGWRVLVIWQCELNSLPQLTVRLRRFLQRSGM